MKKTIIKTILILIAILNLSNNIKAANLLQNEYSNFYKKYKKPILISSSIATIGAIFYFKPSLLFNNNFINNYLEKFSEFSSKIIENISNAIPSTYKTTFHTIAGGISGLIFIVLCIYSIKKIALYFDNKKIDKLNNINILQPDNIALTTIAIKNVFYEKFQHSKELETKYPIFTNDFFNTLTEKIIILLNDKSNNYTITPKTDFQYYINNLKPFLDITHFLDEEQKANILNNLKTIEENLPIEIKMDYNDFEKKNITEKIAFYIEQLSSHEKLSVLFEIFKKYHEYEENKIKYIIESCNSTIDNDPNYYCFKAIKEELSKKVLKLIENENIEIVNKAIILEKIDSLLNDQNYKTILDSQKNTLDCYKLLIEKELKNNFFELEELKTEFEAEYSELISNLTQNFQIFIDNIENNKNKDNFNLKKIFKKPLQKITNAIKMLNKEYNLIEANKVDEFENIIEELPNLKIAFKSKNKIKNKSIEKKIKIYIKTIQDTNSTFFEQLKKYSKIKKNNYNNINFYIQNEVQKYLSENKKYNCLVKYAQDISSATITKINSELKKSNEELLENQENEIFISENKNANHLNIAALNDQNNATFIKNTVNEIIKQNNFYQKIIELENLKNKLLNLNANCFNNLIEAVYKVKINKFTNTENLNKIYNYLIDNINNESVENKNPNLIQNQLLQIIDSKITQKFPEFISNNIKKCINCNKLSKKLTMNQIKLKQSNDEATIIENIILLLSIFKNNNPELIETTFKTSDKSKKNYLKNTKFNTIEIKELNNINLLEKMKEINAELRQMNKDLNSKLENQQTINTILKQKKSQKNQQKKNPQQNYFTEFKNYFQKFAEDTFAQNFPKQKKNFLMLTNNIAQQEDFFSLDESIQENHENIMEDVD